MSALVARDIRVPLGRKIVIDGVDFAVRPGEVVGLIGPNGAGKTTLLRALAGLLPVSRGEVALDGKPFAALDGRGRARHVAFLPQGGTSHWPLAVRRIVELGRLPHRDPMAGLSALDHAAIDRAIVAADVANFADRPFDELSGGERARVLLARVLAVEAPVLLADEPVSALDPAHQLQVMDILRARAAGGSAVVTVLHDLVLAARFCDRIVLLDRGRKVADGRPGDVLTEKALATTYGVGALAIETEAGTLMLPWRRLESGSSGA